MRILFIAHDLAQAGSQHSLLRLIQYLKKATDWKLAVLALGSGSLHTTYAELIPVKIIPRPDISSQILHSQDKENCDSAINELYATLGGNPNCILGNTVVSPLAYPYLDVNNIPIVTRIAEMEKSVYRYSSPEIIKTMIEYSTAYIAVSSPVQSMLQKLGIALEKITCLPGVISDYSTPHENAFRTQWERNYNIPSGTPILWGCGTVSHRKGADLFFEACTHLYDLGAHNFRAVWAGTPDDSLAEWLATPRKRNPAQNNIHFLGQIEKPYRLMKPGDIFVLSSREDPFPLAALEASERGLPIVGFEESGGMVDFIHAETGLLARKEDAAHLARQIFSLLEHTDLLKKFGQNARRHVLSNFTMQVVGPKWIEFFESMTR